MSEHEIQQLVLHRFMSVQSPVALWRLNLRVQWRRMTWRVLVNSANVAKRLVDVVASLLFITILSPLFLMLALLIWIEDGRPVLFSQTRVGKWGREFKMHKFRSMCRNAEALFPTLADKNQHAERVTFKMKNDPRITRIGRWMRRFSLDELPQFFNVLKGDMSLVGPRPPLPREVAHYSLADRRRLETTPGITCLWQISGRSEIDFSGQVQLDVRYIESQSFWIDMKILLATPSAVLSGRGAC
jgi:lipopolysaccharide/colanic/teichoic acid biosynthesis glycosyltransferase